MVSLIGFVQLHFPSTPDVDGGVPPYEPWAALFASFGGQVDSASFSYGAMRTGACLTGCRVRSKRGDRDLERVFAARRARLRRHPALRIGEVPDVRRHVRDESRHEVSKANRSLQRENEKYVLRPRGRGAGWVKARVQQARATTAGDSNKTPCARFSGRALPFGRTAPTHPACLLPPV